MQALVVRESLLPSEITALLLPFTRRERDRTVKDDVYEILRVDITGRGLVDRWKVNVAVGSEEEEILHRALSEAKSLGTPRRMHLANTSYRLLFKGMCAIAVAIGVEQLEARDESIP